MTPYSPSKNKPWTAKQINLVVRRLGFGCSLSDIDLHLNSTPESLIDDIVDGASNMEVTTAPEWSQWDNKQFNKSVNNKNYYHTIWQRQAFKDIINNGFRERLTLFWSNHFVVEYKDVNQPAYLYQYYALIQSHALGNFKTFVSEMGLAPAMLRYLNGFENKKNSPNENYARELYELFTLGEGNGYIQEDINETARALTGYNRFKTYLGVIEFNENSFDKGSKTIFGRSGNWGYNDVIDILFEEKKDLIANFICNKIYRYFVSPQLNSSVVSAMAETFKQNEFELKPVLKQLFKSEHFFDSVNSNVIIKSPIDLMLGLHHSLSFEYKDNVDLELNFRNKCREMGQEVFSPVDVAGWQGNHDWINSETLPKRWEFADYLLIKYWQKNKNQFKTFIQSLVGSDQTDLRVIVTQLKDFMFCPYEIKEEEMTDAINTFMGEVPESYFEDGTWSLNSNSVPKQVYDLMRFFITLPEFQLK
ncbi:MAG: DUF1800 domain-containing protein [Bacteroidota bacterium]|nr:DUF1800 domain-containing protein [Bacteroidota bacterium]MEC9195360.1 DUF1800 domain-containing protein [Bacteroidota bacterium]